MKKMIKCVIVTVVMSLAARAWAASEMEETVDGITWRYKVSGGAEITGCELKNSSSGAIAIPSRLGNHFVTSIERCAFSGCSGLTSVTIPDSVTRIGGEAFSGCSKLTSVMIPSGVRDIGDGAFSGCSKLTSVTISSGVRSIGRKMFSGCSKLTSVTIPDSVTSIGDEAFSGCSKLTSVMIPSGVREIGEWAFSGCSKLTSVMILSGVMYIGDGAFSGCIELTSVTIPDSVTSIGREAFSGCSGLKSIVVDTANPNFKSIAGDFLSMDDKILINGMNMLEINFFYSFIRCREKSGAVQVQIRTVGKRGYDDAERPSCHYWDYYWDNSRGSVDVEDGRSYPLDSTVRVIGDDKMSARAVFEFGDNASLVASEGAEFAIKRSGGPQLTLVILKGRIDLKLPLELKEGLFRVETPFCSCENLTGESWFKYNLVDRSASSVFDDDKDDDFGRHDNIIVHCVTGSMAISCGAFKFPRLVATNQIRITRVPGPRDPIIGSRQTFVTSIKGEAGDCKVLLDKEKLRGGKKAEEVLEKANAFDFLLSPQCVVKESDSYVMGSRTHFSITTINVGRFWWSKGDKKNYIDLHFPDPRETSIDDDF